MLSTKRKSLIFLVMLCVILLLGLNVFSSVSFISPVATIQTVVHNSINSVHCCLNCTTCKKFEVKQIDEIEQTPTAVNPFGSGFQNCLIDRDSDFCRNTYTFVPSPQQIANLTTSESRQLFLEISPPFYGNCSKNKAEGSLEWCIFKGLCVTDHNGLYLPEMSPTGRLYTTSDPTVERAFKIKRPPMVAKTFSTETFLGVKNVYWLKGNTWISDCWKCKKVNGNPAHFLFGIGKLFSHMVGVNFGDSTKQPIDNIILHQCSSVFKTDYTSILTKFFWSFGVTIGLLSERTNLVIIPYDAHEAPNPDMYCMSGGVHSDHVGEYSLGKNGPEVLDVFKKKLAEFASSELSSKPDFSARSIISEVRTSRSTEPKTKVSGCTLEKSTKLRINIFQRTGGSAMRNFVNLAEVVALIKEYTDQVVTFSTSEDMGFWEQYSIFQMYDILISPHGSQLTNSIFAASNKTAIIEVVATCINFDFQRNLEASARYTISSGHTPIARPELAAVRDRCETRKKGSCGTFDSCTPAELISIKQSNLVVDIDNLRNVLEEHIRALC